MQQSVHVEGYLRFINVVAREVHALVIAEILDDHALLALKIGHGLVRHFRGNGELLHGLVHQQIARIVHVPVFRETHEQIQHAGLGPQRA